MNKEERLKKIKESGLELTDEQLNLLDDLYSVDTPTFDEPMGKELDEIKQDYKKWIDETSRFSKEERFEKLDEFVKEAKDVKEAKIWANTKKG